MECLFFVLFLCLLLWVLFLFFPFFSSFLVSPSFSPFLPSSFFLSLTSSLLSHLFFFLCSVQGILTIVQTHITTTRHKIQKFSINPESFFIPFLVKSVNFYTYFSLTYFSSHNIFEIPSCCCMCQELFIIIGK